MEGGLCVVFFGSALSYMFLLAYILIDTFLVKQNKLLPRLWTIC